MPIPLIVWGIGAGIATLLAGCTIIATWDDIKKWWGGKRIAIIGARGVGKTHLCSFLLKGEIPEEYEQTTEPTKFSGRKLKLDDLKLKIDDIIDVPGAKDYYKIWQENCKIADIILYLVKANEIFSDNHSTLSRIESDFVRVNDWLKSRTPKPLFFVVGTFCDKHSEFKNITPSNFGDYKDKFEQKEIIKKLKLFNENNKFRSAVILGSMKDKVNTEKLVKSLLDQVLLEK